MRAADAKTVLTRREGKGVRAVLTDLKLSHDRFSAVMLCLDCTACPGKTLPPLLPSLLLTLIIRILHPLVEVVDIIARIVIIVLHALPKLIHIIARLIVVVLHALLSLATLVLRSAKERAELVGGTLHHVAHVVGHVFDALLHVVGDVFDGLLVLADVVAGAVETALWSCRVSFLVG